MALTATDLNSGMLDYAQKKLNKLKGIDWREADIAALPFPESSFNVVACQFGLMLRRIGIGRFRKCAESWSKEGRLP